MREWLALRYYWIMRTLKNKPYAIFLDDCREPHHAYLTGTALSLLDVSGIPEQDWVVVKNYEEFVRAIDIQIPDSISFDHDLCREHIEHYFFVTQQTGIIRYADLKHKTGMHCAVYLMKKLRDTGYKKKPKIFIHTANVWGAEHIKNVLKKIL